MKNRILHPLHDATGTHLLSLDGLLLRQAWLDIEARRIEAELAVPSTASGWVLFPRQTPYTATVARHFNQAGLATMRAELDLRNVPAEEAAASVRRLRATLAWLRRQSEYDGQPVGLFTGGDPEAAVALHLAGAQASSMASLACWGAAEAMTGYAGPAVDVPTMLMIGEPDRCTRRQMQRWMRRRLTGTSELIVVPRPAPFAESALLVRL